MSIKYRHWISVVFWCVFTIAHAQEGVALKKANNDLCDKASLQRGAQLYMNFCAGCHSLQFVRFKEMAKDLGVVDKQGLVLEQLVNDNLNFISDKINQPIIVATPKTDAAKWFGVAPPDLSLVTRSRGKNWVYTYLLSFYSDTKRPWGVNNHIFPDVAMPNVLEGLHGEILEQAAIDLVNFLDYVGEPHKLQRERMGVWVLLFLVVFTLFAYLLKREYWKDVH